MIKHIRKSITITKDLWTEALEKAESIQMSLSGVIRRLLLLWIDGKIDL
jgi:hypothetical protein